MCYQISFVRTISLTSLFKFIMLLGDGLDEHHYLVFVLDLGASCNNRQLYVSIIQRLEY
jgi:hypothetical protein